MKLKAFIFAWLLAATAMVWAQSSDPFNPAQPTTVSWPLSNPPQAVPSGNVSLGGSAVQPGNSTYYFWVVANYPIGNATPAGPFVLAGAPPAFSATNYASIAWNPPIGATSYDVLVTTAATPPTGACNCAASVGGSGTSYHWVNNTLVAYTVATLNPANFIITAVNQQSSAGVSILNFLLPSGQLLATLDSAGDWTVTSCALFGGGGCGAGGTPKLALNGGPYTVATLPAGLAVGTLANVSDGNGATPCATGGGSTLTTCQYQGGGLWAQLTGTGGGGVNFSGGTNGQMVYRVDATHINTGGTQVNTGDVGTPSVSSLAGFDWGPCNNLTGVTGTASFSWTANSCVGLALSGNVATLTMTAPDKPGLRRLAVTQPGTGGPYAITWPGNVIGSPILNPLASSTTYIYFDYDGVNYNAVLSSCPSCSAGIGGEVADAGVPTPAAGQDAPYISAGLHSLASKQSNGDIHGSHSLCRMALACNDTSGSGTAQSCNTALSFTMVSGCSIQYSTTMANTGASLQVTVNGQGPFPVAYQGSTTLAGGYVAASKPVTLLYDGTYLNLQTVATAPSTASVTIPAMTTANYCPDTSVTANTITCSTGATYTSSSAGDVLWVKVANTTTGATTLDVNGIATVNVTDTSGGAITTNLVAGGVYPCRYTSTGPAWQCIGPAATGSGGGVVFTRQVQSSGYTQVNGDYASTSGSIGTQTTNIASLGTSTFNLPAAIPTNNGCSTMVNESGSQKLNISNPSGLLVNNNSGTGTRITLPAATGGIATGVMICSDGSTNLTLYVIGPMNGNGTAGDYPIFTAANTLGNGTLSHDANGDDATSKVFVGANAKTAPSGTSGAITMDLTASHNYYFQMTGNVTSITPTLPAGYSQGFIEIAQGAGSYFSLPASWAGSVVGSPYPCTGAGQVLTVPYWTDGTTLFLQAATCGPQQYGQTALASLSLPGSLASGSVLQGFSLAAGGHCSFNTTQWFCEPLTNAAGVVQLAALPTTQVAQKFFGSGAPGSVAGNLPGDLYSDTTNHNDYWCAAAAGTAAPACTSVTAGGWTQLNGGASFYQTVDNNGSAVTQRPTINFAGPAIQAVDNPGASRTDVSVVTTLIAQKFFGSGAPGSVAGNLPGDFYSDTTNHNDYWCAAAAGTAAPACTSVTAGGWTLLNQPSGATTIPAITTANYCPDTSVTANTITCSTGSTYTSSSNGDVVWVKVANTTTGATTLNANGIATVTVTDTSGGAITTNLLAGGIYPCRYTSTGPAWQCIGPGGTGGGSPGGSTNAIQYNAGGSTFGGVALATNALPRVVTQASSAAPVMMPMVSSGGVGLMVNAKYKTLFTSNITGTGTVNLTDPDTGSDYVVSVGRTACLYWFGGYSSTTSAFTLYENQTGAGTPLIPITYLSTTTNPSVSTFYCLDYTSAGAGTKLAIVATAASSAANIWANIVEADTTSSVITLKLPGGSATTQPMKYLGSAYTIPAGTHLLALNRNPPLPIQAQTYCVNISGGAINVTPYAVQSGGSANSASQEAAVSSVSNNALSPVGFVAGLGGGGTYQLTYGSAGASNTFNCWVSFTADTGTH